jgi:hypothetical protein
MCIRRRQIWSLWYTASAQHDRLQPRFDRIDKFISRGSRRDNEARRARAGGIADGLVSASGYYSEAEQGAPSIGPEAGETRPCKGMGSEVWAQMRSQ